MTDLNTSISITFASIADLVTEAIWAVMEEKVKETDAGDGITTAAAATIIDELYKTNTCGEEQVSEEEEQTNSYEEYAQRMSDIFTNPSNSVYDPCNTFEDNTYNAELIIYRSDPSIAYKLNLINGDKQSVSSGSKIINVTYPINGNTINVDYPIISDLSSSYEIQDFNSKTVLFTENIFGTVDISYQTNYDIVTISVNPTAENDRGDCQCLLFYGGTVNEVNITPPAEDEEMTNLAQCDTVTTTGTAGITNPYEPLVPGEGTCYQRYLYHTSCRCSPYKTVNTEEEIKAVSCSEPFSAATPNGVYSDNFGDVVIEGYVNPLHTSECVEDWEGGTEEYYVDNCCEDSPIDRVLPNCKEWKEVNYGGEDIVKGKDYWIAQKWIYDQVHFVPVSPKDGVCGENTYIWNVDSKNCCDDEFYENIIINENESVEILSLNSSGIIVWEKGLEIFDISITGGGFWLDPYYTKKSMTIKNNSIYIYTDDEACGICTVTVSDGCSTATHSVACTDGVWRFYNDTCGVSKPAIYNADDFISMGSTSCSGGYHPGRYATIYGDFISKCWRQKEWAECKDSAGELVPGICPPYDRYSYNQPFSCGHDTCILPQHMGYQTWSRINYCSKVSWCSKTTKLELYKWSCNLS